MKQNLSLVLSGGGARGTAHIGVIEELLKQGYNISSIAGTSMGSLVGGMYALGKMDEFKHWICSLDRRKVFNLVDFSIGQQGLVKAEKVLKTMQKFAADANIENLSIPYAAVAADIINREEVVFRTGSIYQAIRASIAIPSVITPVKTNTGVLVDGGVMNNIPVNHVHRTDDDLLVVVDVNAVIPVQALVKTDQEMQEHKNRYQEKIKEFYSHLHKTNSLHKKDNFNYLNVVSHSINLMIYQIAQLHLEQYTPDIKIEISRDSCGVYDFYKADELIEMGRFAARESLKKKTELSS